MLTAIAILLMLLWGAGLLTSYTLGGYIHLLVVVALAVVLIRVVRERRFLAG